MTANERVREQLERSGYLRFVLEHREDGAGWSGTMQVAALPVLRADPCFTSGPFWGLHDDVGAHLCDFRSEPGVFGRGSLQLVVDRETGRFWADVDRFNPYRDLVGFFGHAFGEVVPNWCRSAWRWFTRT